MTGSGSYPYTDRGSKMHRISQYELKSVSEQETGASTQYLYVLESKKSYCLTHISMFVSSDGGNRKSVTGPLEQVSGNVIRAKGLTGKSARLQ